MRIYAERSGDYLIALDDHPDELEGMGVVADTDAGTLTDPWPVQRYIKFGYGFWQAPDGSVTMSDLMAQFPGLAQYLAD